MARYTVRVELHHAEGDDYTRLHGYMEEMGFLRYIVDDDSGERFQLPSAEYNISSDDDRRSILSRAKKAAYRTQKKYMVLVTESDGRTWSQLPKWEG